MRGPERDVLPGQRSNRHELERFWHSSDQPYGDLPVQPAKWLFFGAQDSKKRRKNSC